MEISRSEELMHMARPPLRPPLPPPLTHAGITFYPDPPDAAETRRAPSPLVIPHHTVAAIAAALVEVLPSGDFTVDGTGQLVFSQEERDSAWSIAARLEGVTRWP